LGDISIHSGSVNFSAPTLARDKKNFSTAAPLLQAAIFPRHFYYFSAQKFAPFVIYPSLIPETNNAAGAYWKSIPPICFG
jgi:hypothetical protein